MGSFSSRRGPIGPVRLRALARAAGRSTPRPGMRGSSRWPMPTKFRRSGTAHRWDTVQDAIDAIRRGEIVVVVDDEDRENEGDLVMAAQLATPERLAFFVEHTSGLICVPLTAERADELALPLMVVDDNTESMRTAFTVSVDDRHHTTTGISAGDRCSTILALARAGTEPRDLARPGHVFPLRAVAGGVLQRAGHTEASVDLARLAGLEPVAVICEIVDRPRTGMAQGPELARFAAKHNLRMISIADLIRYRRNADGPVRRIDGTTVPMPTPHGTFEISLFEAADGNHHLVLSMGEVSGSSEILVRVHSECLTGDIFRSMRCDCGSQLDAALQMIGEQGRGVVVYLRGQEGRGIGLSHKLRAYALQDDGLDTVDANLALGLPEDNREFATAAQILSSLGIKTVRLITNNLDKYRALTELGLQITERVALVSPANPNNIAYLRTKRERMGHLIDIGDGISSGTPSV